jgi:ABC-type cobalamin/Fe3+-siderophores transport system ATPase subunit
MGILDLNNISFSYGNGSLIRDLSLSVESGKFIGLIGANGSGKSTILKLAAGILTPVSGNVTLWGKAMHLYKGKDRAKLISYLPQMLDVKVPFKVKELISMGLYPYDVPPQLSLEEAISMVDLDDKTDTLIGELSGGERRRVFIAMTLLQGAGILLLDEPLANLDVRYQIEFVRLLRDLRDKKDISIVMAVHDINMAVQFDFLYVIKNGEMRASGIPAEIMTTGLLNDVFEVQVNIYRQEDGTISFGY